MPGGFAQDSGPCPCGGGEYSRCCGPLHRRERRALRQACRQTRWLGLSILAVDGGGAANLEGTVRFEALHREGVLVETSLFQRRGGTLAGE